MILAARMGPTPKIWVRVVPEASTSASMRPLRSVIFLSSVLTLSAAPPKPAAGAGGRKRPFGTYVARRMRAALSAESFPVTPPGRRSRRSAWRLP
jgi:hypothetical protein